MAINIRASKTNNQRTVISVDPLYGSVRFCTAAENEDVLLIHSEDDKVLPFDTKPALVEAYHAWQVNGAEAEENENFFIAADEWFEKKEKIIDKILENYSKTL